MDYSQTGSSELAYLGDAVLELMVRDRLVRSGETGAGRLNKLSVDYVRATAQSAALERILPVLDETEKGVCMRARNNSKPSTPKSASAVEYRRATGFEALFGYLWLEGKSERMEQLFTVAYGDGSKN